MKNTETVTTLSDETFQLTPLRFYACLALYLFAFFFKAQVLALFWGAFLLALLSDLSKKPGPRWSNHPLLFRIALCGLLTYGFALGQAVAVSLGHLLSMLYLSLMPQPKIIEAQHWKRFKPISLIVLIVMTITLYTHGVIIHT